VCLLLAAQVATSQDQSEIGREVAIQRHLQDGEEGNFPVLELVRYGKKLFDARFTIQEGAGRPLTKGTGAPISDSSSPLTFPRNKNRISGPDANSCSGCHNAPFSGGAGDITTNVFVSGQRFDFVSFNPNDVIPTRGGLDEKGQPVTLQSIANSRSTVDMFGAGYYEMLARQITADLQSERNSLNPGQSIALVSKGISFGALARRPDGSWDTSGVQGLPPQSVASTDSSTPPSLLILPFHQSASTVSLRVFSNDAFNQHHGMQSTERFGANTDPDGDGIPNELTKADITAATVFQATLPVPVRERSINPTLVRAVQDGETLFQQIGCASCHVPALPLDKEGWIYTEPGPYNPPGNAQPGDTPMVSVDLTSPYLPQPRLQPVNGVVMVPLYTDFKLHDITRGAEDPNAETLNVNFKAGADGFFAGNRQFLTRRLWGVGSKPNYFHHGQFSTIREAILNHFGEATAQQQSFSQLNSYQQGAIIEFLKTMKAPSGRPPIGGGVR
jgi:cytochrome c peroxidase